MGARIGSCVDQSPTQFHVAIVVGADLGDDVGGVTLADGHSPQLHRIHAASSSDVHMCRNDGLATHDHQSGAVSNAFRARTYRLSRAGRVATRS